MMCISLTTVLLFFPLISDTLSNNVLVNLVPEPLEFVHGTTTPTICESNYFGTKKSEHLKKLS